MSATHTSEDEEYADLAEDPDVAFRQLERKFRAEMDEHSEHSEGRKLRDFYSLVCKPDYCGGKNTRNRAAQKLGSAHRAEAMYAGESLEIRTRRRTLSRSGTNPAQPSRARIFRALGRGEFEIKNPPLP